MEETLPSEKEDPVEKVEDGEEDGEESQEEQVQPRGADLFLKKKPVF